MLFATCGREPGKSGVSAFLSFLCVMMIWYSGCGKADKALSVPVFAERNEPGQESLDDGADHVGLSDVTGQLGAAASVNPEDMQEQICVYVCGAVLEPRVVTLPLGSRVDEALQAAGGFAEDADRSAVNLAALLSDGQKVYFPALTEEWTETVQEQTPDNRVNINTADVAGLCTLPGIGQARAETIIAYREQNGPFDKIEDIMKVSGIKEGAFEKIKALITVR